MNTAAMARVLAAAAELTGLQADALTVLVKGPGFVVRVKMPPGELNGHATPDHDLLGLSAIDVATLDACDNVSRSAKEIARKVGYSLGRVRESIARLSGFVPPLVVRTARGIRRMPEGRPAYRKEPTYEERQTGS